MKVQITMNVDSEYADENDETGLTEKGFEEVMESLMSFGYDIEIEKVDEPLR